MRRLAHRTADTAGAGQDSPGAWDSLPIEFFSWTRAATTLGRRAQKGFFRSGGGAPGGWNAARIGRRGKLRYAIFKGDIWQIPPGLWLIENEVGGWTLMRPEDY